MSFHVTILGASGAMPAYGRFPSAQLVEIQNESFLVDCGEGTQMQLLRFQQNLHRINHILISHLHGDHFLGLMGLIFTMHLNRRTNDLHIYSQRGLDDIITTTLRHSRSAPNFKLVFHALDTTKQVIFENAHLTVETIPLTHKLPCTGFLFKEKTKPRRIIKETLPEGLKLQQLAGLKRGEDVLDDNGQILFKNSDLTREPKRSRSYAYCSDTQFDKNLSIQLAHVNLLYHEATFTEDELDRAKETKHSTAAQAAEVAKLAKADKLLLGHFSARYRELDPILMEAKKIFQNVLLAEEGKTYHIEE